MKNKEKKIAIVGAGMSGLTAGVYLTRSGHSVRIFEKNKQCGGLVNTFENEGFFFDAGPKSILNAGIIKPMLKQLDINLDLPKGLVSIGIEDQIIDFDSKESMEDYKQLLKHFYPESIEDIEQVIKIIEKVWKSMEVLYGIDNPFFKNLLKDTGYVFKDLVPWLGKFLWTLSRISKMQEPVEDYLEKICSNRSLIDIITQHFFKDTPMFFALGYFYVYLDYMYPKGGTGNIPKLLQQKIIEWGGEIKNETEITKIEPSESNIIDSKGNTYLYDYLVWCADLKTFYASIDNLHYSEKTCRRIEEQRKKLVTKRGGDSIFEMFAGIDVPPDKFKQISNGHFFYTPSKKGLGELHRSKIKFLIDNFETTPKQDVLDWLDEFCKYNTYEISIPSLRDSSLSPEGKTGINISMLFEYDLIKRVQEAGWHQQFKGEIEERIMEVMSNSIYPGIREKLLFKFSTSPLDIEGIAGTSEGAITGWSYESPVPVVDDLRKVGNAVKTPFPNIWKAGQWAYSPAGIPTAILTGWFAAKQIKKKI